MHPAHLKLELAARGIRLDSSVRERTEVVRSASNGLVRGLELALPGDLCVGVPLDDVRSAHSPFVLAARGAGYVLWRGEAGSGDAVAVRAAPLPRFYSRRTSRGTPMARIATMQGSYLVVHPVAACGFSIDGAPCRFCVEGARTPGDGDAASVPEVLEVVRAAFDECSCQLIYFNTAFFEGEDGGIVFLEPYIAAVRRHYDIIVAAQVHPPRSTRWIDRTYAMGVDAVSYNLEMWDPEALKRHCIGRARYIGRERYLEALAHAAAIFPSGTVWTELVFGLESLESARAGIDALAAMGVVPVVALAGRADMSIDPDAAAPLLAHLYRVVKERGISMRWIRDLARGITPLEARHFAGDGARLAVAMQTVTRWRLGGLATRGLARARRRLRVRRPDEMADETRE